MNHKSNLLTRNLRTNYVLIDFESVQPESLAALEHDHFKVLVFVGATQTKVSFKLASEMQRMGDKAEYIKIAGSGPNALDFSYCLLHWRTRHSRTYSLLPHHF